MRTSAKHVFRIATLVAPSLLAWLVALLAPNRDALTRAVARALGPIWIMIAAGFVLRTVVVLHGRRRDRSPTFAPAGVLSQLDLLTSAGAALSWISAFAVIGAVRLGWASLAVLGLLGMGVFHLVTLYAFVALRRIDPADGATFVRRFSSITVTEGDDIAEELVVSDVRIPVGFRFFLSGRMGPRWATTRHVLEASEAGGEIVLESFIGPAVRGTHQAELIEVWLEDVFGLCRSMATRVAPAELTVLPRPRPIERVEPLLGSGLGERTARPAYQLPTEGSFRLREYEHGDDVRRIHWIRSLAAGELIVRLPDELPPDQPRVRLVLDTFFPESFAFSCDAPAEMLDLMVAIWLGVGRALADRGVRVTLVTAAPTELRDPRVGGVVMKRHRITPRAPHGALLLGAEVAWQSQLPIEALLTDESTLIVSHRIMTAVPSDSNVRWLMVAVPSGTEPKWNLTSSARVPYPMGHSENRWSHRQRATRALHEERRDHARAMRAMSTSVVPAPQGSYLAVPTTTNTIRLERLA